jgi:hypothetical protein
MAPALDSPLVGAGPPEDREGNDEIVGEVEPQLS